MSATRKILLVLSILVGLLGSFQVFDLVTSDFAESEARTQEARLTELRRLEAGESPNGTEIDGKAREARISDLRAWTASAAEQAALNEEDARQRWGTAILMLMIAGGLGGAVFVMGRADSPRVLVRLGQLPAGVIVAGLVGLLSATFFFSFVQVAFEERAELTSAEARLLETKRKLESFEFDARGDIAPDQHMDFVITMETAKYAPQEVQSAQERLLMAIGIVAASAIALGLSVFFGRRSWARSTQPVRAAPPGTFNAPLRTT